MDGLYFEGLKLAVQAIVALGVARLTVVWALSRYKAEKVWERRLGAHADLVTALGEMRRINGAWMIEEEEGRELTEDFRQIQSKRYGDASRKVQEVSAVARLLLDKSTITLLDEMENGLAEARSSLSYWEHLDADGYVLRVALDSLISDGRSTLSIDRG